MASAAGPLFFYPLSNSANAFRCPLQKAGEDRSEDVLRAEVDTADDRPNGMVPILEADATAWLSLSQENRLSRVTFAR